MKAYERTLDLQTRAAAVWSQSCGLAALLEKMRDEEGFNPDTPWGGPAEAAWTMAKEIQGALQQLTSQLDPAVILREEADAPPDLRPVA